MENLLIQCNSVNPISRTLEMFKETLDPLEPLLRVLSTFRTLLLSSEKRNRFAIRTSRERPKSAPYLRLKIEKVGPSDFVKLQLVAKNEKKGGPFGDMKKFPKKFLK